MNNNLWGGLLGEVPKRPQIPGSIKSSIGKPLKNTAKLAKFLMTNGPMPSYELARRLGWTARQIRNATKGNKRVHVSGYVKMRRPGKRTLSSISLHPGAATARVIGPLTANPIRDLLLIDDTMSLDEVFHHLGWKPSTIRNAVYRNQLVFNVTRKVGATSPQTVRYAVYAYQPEADTK